MYYVCVLNQLSVDTYRYYMHAYMLAILHSNNKIFWKSVGPLHEGKQNSIQQIELCITFITIDLRDWYLCFFQGYEYAIRKGFFKYLYMACFLYSIFHQLCYINLQAKIGLCQILILQIDTEAKYMQQKIQQKKVVLLCIKNTYIIAYKITLRSDAYRYYAFREFILQIQQYQLNTHCDIVLYSFIMFSQIEYTLRYCVVFIYNILIVSLEVVFNKIYCEMWLQQQQRRFKAESFQQFFFCFSLFFPYCISHQGAPPKNGQFGKKKPFRPSFFERGGGGALTWINTV
eukprot:TRINITY_DN3108_c0_g1_i8.p2 TRINITY_DN3108_c0_g1~~TRINITY_DN3108_c0_g1_i8.p2  ORF type:complete len:287 (-),score=-20.15 TRINITY_DN3108_c0_g1_i8:582-1442(-)